MIRFRFAVVAAALFCLLGGISAHAQMPTDNDTWKARCSALASLNDLNHPTPQLVALTRGIPGAKFVTFGFDRDAAGQHNVACTLFFLGAIAEQAGNGAAPNASVAQDDLVLADLQVKTLHNQSATFSERFTSMKAKAMQIMQPALTETDEENVMNAATTIPFSDLAALDPSRLRSPGKR